MNQEQAKSGLPWEPPKKAAGGGGESWLDVCLCDGHVMMVYSKGVSLQPPFTLQEGLYL